MTQPSASERAARERTTQTQPVRRDLSAIILRDKNRQGDFGRVNEGGNGVLFSLIRTSATQSVP